MDLQNVAKLDIPDGEVRTIHDKDGNLIWGKVSYSVKYKGDTVQNGTPTPDAPVAVQTVTGEQTISIDSTSYKVDLGSIELCKIGTYQDYIYKDGTDWKIHKTVDFLQLTGSESNYTTRSNTSSTHSKFRIASQVLSGSIASVTSIACSHFIANAGANDAAYSSNAICGSTTAGYQTQLWFSVENSIATTAAGFQTWVTNNKPYLYYALATATDTTITNSALIAQLEAILAGGTQGGVNNIALTPSAGATGTLEVEYYDSYDSYLWVNNRWEKFAHLG